MSNVDDLLICGSKIIDIFNLKQMLSTQLNETPQAYQLYFSYTVDYMSIVSLIEV